MTIGLSSTNRVQHAIIREATYGVTPASPAFRDLRTTGSTLAADPMTTPSNELRSDRQVPDLILVGMQSKGDINAEMSFSELDPDFEEALQGQWQNKPFYLNTAAGTPITALTASTIAVVSGGGAFVLGHYVSLQGFVTPLNNRAYRVSSSTATVITFAGTPLTADASPQAGASVHIVGFQGAASDIAATAAGLTSTALNFTTLGLTVGEWLNIGGAGTTTQFATAANNGWARLSAIAANALTFDIFPMGWTADAGTGKGIICWIGDLVRNGTTQYSNTVEKQYQDQATPSFEYITGLCLNKLSLTLTSQQVVKAVKSYVGSTTSVTTTRLAGATDILPGTYPVLNASANVGELGFAGTADIGPDFVLELSLSINNNLRPLYALESIGAIGQGDGTSEITGSLNSYFGDTLYYENLLSNTAVSLFFQIGPMGAVNGPSQYGSYFVDMPYIKLSSGSPTVPAQNQSVMLPLGFQALRSPVYGYQIQIQRFWLVQ